MCTWVCECAHVCMGASVWEQGQHMCMGMCRCRCRDQRKIVGVAFQVMNSLVVCICVCAFEYTCVHMNVESKGQPWMSVLGSCLPCLLETSALWSWSPWLGYDWEQWALDSCLSSSHPRRATILNFSCVCWKYNSGAHGFSAPTFV